MNLKISWVPTRMEYISEVIRWCSSNNFIITMLVLSLTHRLIPNKNAFLSPSCDLVMAKLAVAFTRYVTMVKSNIRRGNSIK